MFDPEVLKASVEEDLGLLDEMAKDFSQDLNTPLFRKKHMPYTIRPFAAQKNFLQALSKQRRTG